MIGEHRSVLRSDRFWNAGGASSRRRAPKEVKKAERSIARLVRRGFGEARLRPFKTSGIPQVIPDGASHSSAALASSLTGGVPCPPQASTSAPGGDRRRRNTSRERRWQFCAGTRARRANRVQGKKGAVLLNRVHEPTARAATTRCIRPPNPGSEVTATATMQVTRYVRGRLGGAVVPRTISSGVTVSRRAERVPDSISPRSKCRLRRPISPKS